MTKQVLTALVAIVALALLLWSMLGRTVASHEGEVKPVIQGGAAQSTLSEAPSSSAFRDLERTVVHPPTEVLPQFGKLAIRCPGLDELSDLGKWVYETKTLEGVVKRVSLSAEELSVDLSPGVWLLVEEPDLFRSTPVVNVLPGKTAIVLARSLQSYTFTVHDDSGFPIEGALLEWEAGPMILEEKIFGRTNENGEAGIDLPAALGSLTISHPKYWTATIALREGVGGHFPIVLSPISQELWEVDFVEKDGGEPIHGLAVEVVDSPSQSGHSNEMGAFSFSPRDGDGAVLQVKGKNHVALEITVDSPLTTLRLPEASRLEVQVFDSSGNPLEGARVQVRCSEPRDYSGPNGGDFIPMSGVSDYLGNLVLGVPGEIPLEVTVSAEGYFSYLGETSVSMSGAIFSVHLSHSEPLALTLLDPQGRRVKNARIMARSLEGATLVATPEGNGIYSFSSSAGLVSIRIEKQGYVGIIGSRSSGKILDESGLGGSLVLTLSEGYEVQGRVLWDSGKPAANTEVSLLEAMLSERETTVIQAKGNALGWRWTTTPGQRRAFTDSNGEFNFFGIEAGDWEVNWKTPDGRFAVVALKYASFDFKSISVPTAGPVSVVLPEPVFVVIAAVSQQTGRPVPSFDLESSHPDYVPMLNPESPVQANLLRGWFQRHDLEYLTVVAPGYFPFPLASASLQRVTGKELHYSVPLIPLQTVELQVVLPDNCDEEGVSLTIQAYSSSGESLALVDENLRQTYSIAGSKSIIYFDCPVGSQGVRLQLSIASPKGNLQIVDPDIWVSANDSVTIEVRAIKEEEI